MSRFGEDLIQAMGEALAHAKGEGPENRTLIALGGENRGLGRGGCASPSRLCLHVKV